MAQFVANLVKNSAKSLLKAHLSRERPKPPHRPDLYLVPLQDAGGAKQFEGTEGAAPGAAREGAREALRDAFLGEVRVCRPLPPRFDEELARLLRNLAVAWELAALRHSRSALVVLQGSTLHGWFHVGSQLPWKSDIHVAVVLLPARRQTGAPTMKEARSLRSESSLATLGAPTSPQTQGGAEGAKELGEAAAGAKGAKELGEAAAGAEGAKELGEAAAGAKGAKELGEAAARGSIQVATPGRFAARPLRGPLRSESLHSPLSPEVDTNRIRILAERIFRDMEPLLETQEIFPPRRTGGGGGSGGSTLAASVWSVRGERPDRSHVRLYSYLQHGSRLADGVTLRRATIDGGNTSVHVPWPRGEVVRQLRRWHEQRCKADANARLRTVARKRGGSGGGKVKIGAALTSIPTLLHNRLEDIRDKHGADAAARLHMPSGWRYLPEKNAFHIPNRVEAAFSWPPSFATVSTAIYVLLFLFVLYVVCTSVLPGVAYSMDRRARAATRARRRARKPSPGATPRAENCPSPFGLGQSGGRLRPSGSATFQES